MRTCSSTLPVPTCTRRASSPRDLVALAEEHRSAEHIADAKTYLALARMYSGDFERANQDFNQSWALLESIARPPRTNTFFWRMGPPQNNRALSGCEPVVPRLSGSRRSSESPSRPKSQIRAKDPAGGYARIRRLHF